jgi:hypothetical protein
LSVTTRQISGPTEGKRIGGSAPSVLRPHTLISTSKENIMSTRHKRRAGFCPSATDAKLEQRIVLSSASAVTPTPAPAPFFSSVVIGSPIHANTVAQLRHAYTREVALTAVDLRSAVGSEIGQLFANGAAPTQQQLTDFNANVQGALDATALQLSSQASLLPGSNTRLVPGIQNALLGSDSNSLSSRLTAALQSSHYTASAARLQSVFARAFTAVPRQISSQINHFFGSTNFSQLSVSSSGQQVPLSQFMGNQVISQMSNTLGMLAQSFPTVAASMLFPNGTTATPTQDLIRAFNTQATNALTTAALQLGSSLSMFGGFSTVASKIQPVLFGSVTNLPSLESSLQNLSFGSTGFASAVASAFNTGFNSLLAPINSFLGMATQGQSNSVLPTAGLTNPFSSQFTKNSFDNGFNNGFASDTNSGFVGFGTAPSAFDTNFGAGFNNVVSTVSQGLGISPISLGTTGTAGGVDFQSR